MTENFVITVAVGIFIVVLGVHQKDYIGAGVGVGIVVGAWSVSNYGLNLIDRIFGKK